MRQPGLSYDHCQEQTRKRRLRFAYTLFITSNEVVGTPKNWDMETTPRMLIKDLLIFTDTFGRVLRVALFRRQL